MGLIGSLFVKLGLNNKDYKRKLKDSERQTNNFGKTMKKIGGWMAAAFGVAAITNWLKESVKVAAQAEGIERAFRRIGGMSVFADLKQSVKGTVSELKLMKYTVQASNFGLPIQNLASLFKFATARANETGESVDYLVNSIVLGIGRKSPLILDNLGISAVRLRQELKGVGVQTATVGDIAQVVGRIADEEMKKMGDQAITYSQKMAVITAKWDDLKKNIGAKIVEQEGGMTSFLNNVLDHINKITKSKKTIKFERIELTKKELSNYDTKKEKQDKAFVIAKSKANEIKDILGKKNLLFQRPKSFDKIKTDITSIKELKGSINAINIVLDESRNAISLITSDERKKAELYKMDLEAILKVLNDMGNKKKKKKTPLELPSLEKYKKQLEEIEKLIQKSTSIKNTRDLANEYIKVNQELDKYISKLGTMRNIEKGKAVKSIKGNHNIKLNEPDITPSAEMADLNKREEEFTSYIDHFEEEKYRLQMLTDSINSEIQNFGISFAESLGEALAVDTTQGWKDFENRMLSGIGSAMVSIGTQMIIFSKIFIVFKKAIASMNPFVALGAGVALVAAGSALRAAAQESMNNDSSGYSNGYSAPDYRRSRSNIDMISGGEVKYASVEEAGKSYNFTADFKIKGNDLVALHKQAELKNKHF